MSFGKRTVCIGFASVCLCLLISAPSAAQLISSSDARSIAQPALDAITDVFIGKNTKGPYVLSWNNVAPEGEMVIVSGRKLLRGPDYTIDYTSGAVAFSEYVPHDAIIRVTYNGTPGKSAATGGGMNIPVSARLLSGEKASLDATGFYKGGGATGGVSVLGLSGNVKPNDKSNFSSSFLIANGAEGKDGQNTDLLDRSAMKLGASTSVGALQFKGSLSRSGEQFAASNQYGLQHAKELLDLGATWGKTTDTVYASFTYREQEDLAGAGQGATQTASEQKVVLNLADDRRVTLSRSENEKVSPNGPGNAATTDLLRIEQGFGQKTKATASLETTETTFGASTTAVKTSRVALQSSAIDNVQLTGGVVWKDSEQVGGEMGVDFGINAVPTDRINIDASYSNLVPDNDSEQTRTAVRVAANPTGRMRLEATYAGMQIANGTDEQQRAVRVEAQPAGYMKLSAGLREEETGTETRTNREAAIELAPSSRVRIATAFRELENGPNSSIIRDYSGTVKPVDFLEVSGIYRNRETIGADGINTKDLKLALGPWDTFKLTGQYAYNPEDNKGNVQRYSSATLGVQMRLGIVGITGGYTERDDYMVSRLSAEKEVGLHLPIFGGGRLSTGYKIAEILAEAEQATETFSIGYTHIIGSSFSLSLSGELTKYDYQSMLPQEEYKASAKLGVKF